MIDYGLWGWIQMCDDNNSCLFNVIEHGGLSPNKKSPHKTVSEITLQDQWSVLFPLQFENFARQTFHIGPSAHSLRFVTDGQLPLRQCLHPETCSKNLDLPSYYAYFHDLRKEFRAFYNMPEEPQSIRDMVACILCKIMVRKTLNYIKYNTLFEHMWWPKFEVRLFPGRRGTAKRILSWTVWNKWKAMFISSPTTPILGLPIGNVWCVFCILFLCHNIIVQYLPATGSLKPWVVSWVLRGFA